MTIEDKILKIIQHIFYILGLATVVFTFVLSAMIFPKSEAPVYYTDDYSDGWVTADGEMVNIKDLGLYESIYNTVPEVEVDSQIFINIKCANVKVYMDDELAYQSKLEYPQYMSKTPGIYNIKVLIRPEDAGKTIRIDIDSPYNDHSAKINYAVVGDIESVIKTQINSRMFEYLTSLVSIFIGLVFMILYWPLRRAGDSVKSILYLGIMAFNMGLFTLFDGGMLQVLYGHDGFLNLLVKLFMSLIAVPLLLYLQRQYHGINKAEFIIVAGFSLVSIVGCAVLNLRGILDYHETTRVTHIVFAFTILLVIKSTFKSHSDRKFIHVIGLFAITVGAILDMVLWTYTTMSQTTFFTQIGFIIFLSCEAVQFVINYLRHQREITRQNFVHELAYKDGLTGLLNRTSYEEALQSYRDSGEVPPVVAFFDINRLKYMNDTYGHKLGDELITTISEAISAEFASYGKCYRIGGDEFVFIADKEMPEIDTLKSNVESRLAQATIEGAPEFEVSVAIGYVLRTDTYVSVDEMVNLADQLMYRNKRMSKGERS